MNLTISLSPETEAKLREQAALTGKALEELAVQALEQQLAVGPAPTCPLSPEQWVEDFRDWAKSHRRLPHEADDTRESKSRSS